VKTLHVVQHTSAEYLGLVEDHLEGRGIRFRYHRPFTTQGGLPQASAIGDGLVLLGGGPWGSAGLRDVPTLAPEVALVRACLDRGTPVVGLGVGAQILALAAGGAAAPAPLAFRVGTATRVRDDALAGYLPARYPLAIYMRDWPEPPPGAVVLAQDDDGRACLWQAAPNAFGFAGHPGLKVAMVEDLVMEFEEAPADVAAPLARLRAVQRELEDALVPIMTGLIRATGWMDPPAR
jgi:GMP synthase-like glutamine amidotransferase